MMRHVASAHVVGVGANGETTPSGDKTTARGNDSDNDAVVAIVVVPIGVATAVVARAAIVEEEGGRIAQTQGNGNARIGNRHGRHFDVNHECVCDSNQTSAIGMSHNTGQSLLALEMYIRLRPEASCRYILGKLVWALCSRT